MEEQAERRREKKKRKRKGGDDDEDADEDADNKKVAIIPSTAFSLSSASAPHRLAAVVV